MNNYFKIFFKKYLYFFFIFLIFAHYSSFFTNIYKIFKRNYNERLLRTYDYCENYGYGYVNKINSGVSNDLIFQNKKRITGKKSANGFMK